MLMLVISALSSVGNALSPHGNGKYIYTQSTITLNNLKHGTIVVNGFIDCKDFD